MIRVLVAASSSVTRAGLESLVRAAPSLEWVGSEADLSTLAAAVDREHPDVVLAETEFQPEESLPEILAPAAVVLLVSAPVGPWLAEALRAGIRSALPRDAPVAEIVAAIEAAGAGLVTLQPGDLGALLPAARLDRPTGAEAGESLTARELDVFAMLAEGAGNKAIAWKLGISEHTVKFHVASIMGKLGASSRTEAVTMGIRKGLIML